MSQPLLPCRNYHATVLSPKSGLSHPDSVHEAFASRHCHVHEAGNLSCDVCNLSITHVVHGNSESSTSLSKMASGILNLHCSISDHLDEVDSVDSFPTTPIQSAGEGSWWTHTVSSQRIDSHQREETTVLMSPVQHMSASTPPDFPVLFSPACVARLQRLQLGAAARTQALQAVEADTWLRHLEELQKLQSSLIDLNSSAPTDQWSSAKMLHHLLYGGNFLLVLHLPCDPAFFSELHQRVMTPSCKTMPQSRSGYTIRRKNNFRDAVRARIQQLRQHCSQLKLSRGDMALCLQRLSAVEKILTTELLHLAYTSALLTYPSLAFPHPQALIPNDLLGLMTACCIQRLHHDKVASPKGINHPLNLPQTPLFQAGRFYGRLGAVVRWISGPFLWQEPSPLRGKGYQRMLQRISSHCHTPKWWECGPLCMGLDDPHLPWQWEGLLPQDLDDLDDLSDLSDLSDVGKGKDVRKHISPDLGSMISLKEETDISALGEKLSHIYRQVMGEKSDGVADNTSGGQHEHGWSMLALKRVIAFLALADWEGVDAGSHSHAGTSMISSFAIASRLRDFCLQEKMPQSREDITNALVIVAAEWGHFPWKYSQTQPRNIVFPINVKTSPLLCHSPIASNQVHE